MPAAGTRMSSSRIVVSGSLRGLRPGCWPCCPPCWPLLPALRGLLPGLRRAVAVAAPAAAVAAAAALRRPAGPAGSAAAGPGSAAGSAAGSAGGSGPGPAGRGRPAVVAVLRGPAGGPAGPSCCCLLLRGCFSALLGRLLGRSGFVGLSAFWSFLSRPACAFRLATRLGVLDRLDQLRLLHGAGTADAQAARHRLEVGDEHGAEPTAALLRRARGGVGSGAGGFDGFRHVRSFPRITAVRQTPSACAEDSARKR